MLLKKQVINRISDLEIREDKLHEKQLKLISESRMLIEELLNNSKNDEIVIPKKSINEYNVFTIYTGHDSYSAIFGGFRRIDDEIYVIRCDEENVKFGEYTTNIPLYDIDEKELLNLLVILKTI